MNKHVILKLVTGETLVAELLSSSHHSITVRRPVQVRLLPTVREGNIAEEPVISIYCSFTYDEEYEFRSDTVIFCKPLIDRIIPFYEKTADSLYNVEILTVKVKDYTGTSEAEPMVEEETFTAEDFIKSKIVH